MRNDLIQAGARLPKPEKPRPISKKVRAACDALANGDAKTITAAAAQAGISREFFSREISRKPHVAEYIRAKAARNLLVGSARASMRMTQLIDASSEHVSLEAAKHTLAISGLKPAADPQMSLNINIQTAGYVIDLSEHGDREDERAAKAKLVNAVPADDR